MLYVEQCNVGDIIEVYTRGTSLAEWQTVTEEAIQATYLGYYPSNRDTGDKCLLGWKEQPKISGISALFPRVFQLSPSVNNPHDYFFFRWVGSTRYVRANLGADASIRVPSNSQLKPGQLSPVHVPGWHQCKCGFRNQDISISAFIGGKYTCYSCRNIWKK